MAMERLRVDVGAAPVEFPTTAAFLASPADRAADVNAAFADPTIDAIMTTTGGNDQIALIPYLDADIARAHPKPFFGYSDNTHILNWLWINGIAGFYGGATQTHLGTGPAIDPIHLATLTAALGIRGKAASCGDDAELEAGEPGPGEPGPREPGSGEPEVGEPDSKGTILELTDPGEAEDYGKDWLEEGIFEANEREATEPWAWSGPERDITGITWGGCVDSLIEILLADRFRADEALDGVILLLETTEFPIEPAEFSSFMRALGQRGILGRLAGVMMARPPASNRMWCPPAAERAAYRESLRGILAGTMATYNPDAVVVFGVPFGHTRPQYVVPYGGQVRLDGVNRRIYANYELPKPVPRRYS